MQNHLNHTEHDFKILKALFTSPSNYTDMTSHDLALWPRYQNQLELNMEKKPQLVFPYSYFELDHSDEDELDNIQYDIHSINLEKYPFGASYIDGQVYIHLNSDALRVIIDEAGNTFYLKKMEFHRYLLKPLHEINSKVYPRAPYFQAFSLIYFMKNAGITLKDFLDQHAFLSTEVIQIIGNKIIQAVTDFHEKGYIHTDIKLDNLCIQYHDIYPEESIVSLIDCESSLPMVGNMNLVHAPTPGTFTYYAPEIFMKLPSYVCDFQTLMLFQQLSFEVINGKLNQLIEESILQEHQIAIDKLASSDFLSRLSPKQYLNTFIKKQTIGLFSTKTDLFALGCVLKIIIDSHKMKDTKLPLTEQMQNLITMNPRHRGL